MDTDITYFIQQKKRFLEARIDLQKIKSGIDLYIPILSHTIPNTESESGLDFYDELSKLGYGTFCLFLLVLKEMGYVIEADWLENSLPILFQYKIKLESVGSCLIINNVKFSEPPPSLMEKEPSKNRKGSMEDERVLKQVFENIGYKVVCESNLTAVKMMEKLQFLSDSFAPFTYDSLVVIILTHGNSIGNRDVLYGTDWKPIYKEDIYKLFSNENCFHMQGKPKMFFFQACRGKQCYIRDITSRFSKDAHGYGNLEIQRPFNNINTFSTLSDMIVVHSALPYHTCHRTSRGTIFCQSLAKVLQRDYKRYDLNAMLVSVSKEMVKYHGREEFIHIEYFGPCSIVRFPEDFF